MIVNLQMNTEEKVSAKDKAILMILAGAQGSWNIDAPDVKGSEAQPAEAQPAEAEAAAPAETRSRAGRGRAAASKADTATSELAAAAEPIESANAAPSVTMDDLRKVAGPLAETDEGNDELVKAVGKYGVEKLRDVKKENWDALYDELVALQKKMSRKSAL